MTEPTSANYPVSLDSDVTLGGDARNLIQLTLDTSVNASIQTISVAEDISAISVPCYLLCESELMYATNKSSGNFTDVDRGAGNTNAASHTSSATVYLVYAANFFNQLKRAIIAIETELGTNPSGTQATLVARLLQSIDAGGNLNFTTSSELTIATGSITPTQNWHSVDTESDAGTDDLDTIAVTNVDDGFVLVLRANHTDRTIVLKHNTGNIQTPTGNDFSLTANNSMVVLIYDGTLTKWVFFTSPPASTTDTPVRPNIIINGALDVWQRGTSFPAIASTTNFADRFKYIVVGAAVHTITRDTDVPTFAAAGVKANYSMKVDCTTADASIAATDACVVRYQIEGYDYAKIKDKNVTLTFWVKATKTGTYCVAFRNNGSDRSYVSEYVINSTDTWEKKTITLNINQSGGTENYTNGSGLAISWTISAGSSFQTTANTWQNAAYLATSNQVNGTDSISNDFRLALIKLEEGSTASAWYYETFEDTFKKCLRYYFKTFPYATAPATGATVVGAFRFIAGKAGAAAEFGGFPFPVPMRAAPTVTFYNPSAANSQVRDSTASADCSSTTSGTNASETFCSVSATGNASTAVGNALDVHITAESEL